MSPNLIGSEKGVQVWLCLMCGSKFSPFMAKKLRSGKLVTCEYCGTSID